MPFPWKMKTKGNLSNNCKRFHRVSTNYEVVSRLGKQSKEYRKAELLTSLGTDSLEIVDGLSFAGEEEVKDIDAVLE